MDWRQGQLGGTTGGARLIVSYMTARSLNPDIDERLGWRISQDGKASRQPGADDDAARTLSRIGGVSLSKRAYLPLNLRDFFKTFHK
jgi:hypothetical protein